MERTAKLLVACTGSVATIKLQELLGLLSATDLFDIQIILTKSARHFVGPNLQAIQKQYRVHIDQDEWKWKDRGDPVLHIELRKWADVLLIAPLSANTMAKIVHGICDSLLSLIVRCWNFKKNSQGRLENRIIVCPAMNTLMWENPITEIQLSVLKAMGIQILGPIQKVLMCGQVGNGAMQQVKKISTFLAQNCKKPS